jgi:hypothetical protein
VYDWNLIKKQDENINENIESNKDIGEGINIYNYYNIVSTNNPTATKFTENNVATKVKI